MDKVVKGIIIAAIIFFVIGMIVGNYNCATHFCNMLMGFINFIKDAFLTELEGISCVVSFISGIFS